MAVDLILSAALALLSAPEAPRVPACVELAKSWVSKVEALPLARRARAIELAIRRDPKIFCEVIDQSFFAKPPEPPRGCDASKPAACSFPKGIEVARKLAEDSDPVLYLRVQTIASRLKERGLFADAHERLLATLLLSSQIAREEAH